MLKSEELQSNDGRRRIEIRSWHKNVGIEQGIQTILKIGGRKTQRRYKSIGVGGETNNVC